MTPDTLPDDAISNAAEFEDYLAAIVENAVDADVDVRGAWEFRTRGSTHDWEVQLTELANYPDEDE